MQGIRRRGGELQAGPFRDCGLHLDAMPRAVVDSAVQGADDKVTFCSALFCRSQPMEGLFDAAVYGVSDGGNEIVRSNPHQIENFSIDMS